MHSYLKYIAIFRHHMIKPQIEIEYINGRHLQCAGKEYLFFAGTSYLGISFDPHFQSLVTTHLGRIGVNFGGSRRANYTFSALDELEQIFKEWWQVESFITTSSGSMSGLLVSKLIPSFVKVLYGPGVHPALRVFDSIQTVKIDSHLIMDYLEEASAGNFCLVLNGVDPISLEVLDWHIWENLPQKHQYWYVVDDAHGVGVLEGGKGVMGSMPIELKARVIFVGSLGKAFSLPGGFIAGPSEMVNHVWDLSHFAGASPLIPAYAAAFVDYHERIEYRIKRLYELKEHLAYEMKRYDIDGWRHDYRLPIWACQGDGIDEFLRKSGVLISSFSYPTADDPIINRIVVNANHKEQDLSKLAQLLSLVAPIKL